jgi:hypothetical protein
VDFSDIVQTPEQTPPAVPPEQQRKPYWQVLDDYDKARQMEPEINKMSVQEFSKGMNETTGTNNYDEGLNAGWLRTLAVTPERALHHFGAPAPGKQLWSPEEQFGIPTMSEMLGGPKEGIDIFRGARELGEKGATAVGAPPGVAKAVGAGGEMLAGTLPIAIGDILGGPVGAIATAAGQTYGETGRVLPSVISGAGIGLMGPAGRLGERTALKTLGAKTVGELRPDLLNLISKESPKAVEEASQMLAPAGLVQRSAAVAGRQAGIAGTLLGTGVAQTAFDPNLSWEDKLKQVGQQFSPSNLIATGIGVLPFVGADIISARTSPLTQLERQYRGSFIDRFNKAYTEGYGKPPPPDQVEKVMDRLQANKPIPPDSKVGTVLASMGQAPVETDLPKEIKTTEGMWNSIEAVNSVKARANQMLLAQGSASVDKPEITTAHDPAVSSILKILDGKGLSQEQMTHVAASKLTDLWHGDNENLKTSGYVPDNEPPPFGKETTWQQQMGMEEKIAAAVDPNSKYYDQNVAQRMALLSGDKDAWDAAGIQENLRRQVWEAMGKAATDVVPDADILEKGGAQAEAMKYQAGTSPVTSNIIDMVSRLPAKLAYRIQAIDARIQEEIARGGIFDVRNGTGVLRDPLQKLMAAKAELERLQVATPFEAAARERAGLVMPIERNVGAPNAEATFAARRRAFLYDKPFDITDPKSVGDYVRDVTSVLKQAEKGWARARGAETFVTDEKGNSLRFATKADAETHAQDLQSRLGGQETRNVKYTVPENPEPDGTFRVVEKHFYSLFGFGQPMGEERAGREAGEGEFAARLAEGAEEDTTEKPELAEEFDLGTTTLDEVADEMFSKAFKEMEKHRDPAVVEGRKAALAQNYSDFVNNISDKTFRDVIKAGIGAGIQDTAVWKQRFIRYIQFLRDGGNVDVRVEGNRLTGVGDLASLNRYMDAVGLGFGRYSAKHERAGEEQVSKWNERRPANFFERFAVFSNYMQRFLVNPKTMVPDPAYRPPGDFGWMTPEFKRDLPNKVDVNWTDVPTEDVGIRFRPGVKNRDGSEYRSDIAGIAPKTGTIVTQHANPLADWAIRSAQHDLVTKASDVVKWFERYGNIDPKLIEMAKTLMQRLPFVANQNVGVSMTKDFLNRGFFHTDDAFSSAGILLDPFIPTKTGRLDLQHPRDMFNTLMEELGHSSVDFAWNNDAGFKSEVQRVWNEAKQRLDGLVGLGSAGKFAQIQLTSMRDPREMLAGMFKDPGLHEFLKTIDDPFEPLPNTAGIGSLFDRLFQMIRNLFRNLVGDDGANTLLTRMSELAARGVEIQQGLPLVNRGDIYLELWRQGKLAGDILSAPAPQPVPGAVEPTQVYPPWTPKEVKPQRPGTLPQYPDPVRHLLEQEVQQAEARLSAALHFGYFEPTPRLARQTQRMMYYSGSRGGSPEVAQRMLDQANDRLSRYDRGELYTSELVDSSIIKDRESYLSDLQTQMEYVSNLPATTPEVQQQKDLKAAQLQGEIEQNTKLIELLRKLEKVPEGGTLLESREKVESSPEFRRWFAGSKVVDEQGKPQIVYHGSLSNFDTFDMSKMGAHTGAPSAKRGFFFSSTPETAEGYGSDQIYRAKRLEKIATKLVERIGRSGIRADDYLFKNPIAATKQDLIDLQRYRQINDELEWVTTDWYGGVSLAKKGKRYDVYLNLKNPLVHDFGGEEFRDTSFNELLKQAQEQGHDGAIFRNTYDPSTFAAEGGGDVYVAFQPNQIKSVENRGTFDPTKGSILESRTDPTRVVDAMKAAATYVTEDPKGDLWFKPYSLARFRDTFGPAFGNELRLEVVNSQLGYSVRPIAFNLLTQDDVAKMPPPRVKSWAPSVFETTKYLYRSQGSSEATAEAQAHYVTAYASLLKNTDTALWGTLPDQPTFAAVAYPRAGVAGITPLSATIFPQHDIYARNVVHETAHLAGFTKGPPVTVTPDVQKGMDLVNGIFSSLSPDARKTYLDELSKLLTTSETETYIPVSDYYVNAPEEFAAHLMETTGRNLMNTPHQSQYLRDVLRFAPDEASNLIGTAVLRNTQALDALPHVIANLSEMRGMKDVAWQKVADATAEGFRAIARPALEIAEDQSEFYRLRSVYPDNYVGLLSQLADKLEQWGAQWGGIDKEGTPLPTLKSTLLESRLSDVIETGIRKILRLPTSDGLLPDKLTFWDRYLTQFSQLALKYPILRPVYDMLTVSRAMSQTSRIRLMTALAGSFTGNRVVDDARTKHVDQFVNSPSLQKQFSQIALAINKYGDTKFDAERERAGSVMAMDPQAVTGFRTPGFLNALMDKYGVPDSQKPILHTILDGTKNQIAALGANIVGSRIHDMEMLIAKAVSRHTNMNVQASRELATVLSEALQEYPTDPGSSLQKRLQFRNALGNDDAYLRIVDMAQTGYEGIQELERFLELRMPYFMSERRPGQFGVIWEDANGRMQSQYLANADDQRNYVAKLQKQGLDVYRQTFPNDRDFGVAPWVFKTLEDAQQRMVEKATAVFGANDARDLGVLLDYSSELRSSLQARDVLRMTAGRDLAPGREELNMFQTHQHYINATTAAIRNKFIRAETDLLLSDPSFNNQPELAKKVQDHVKTVLVPDTQFGRQIQQLGFLYYLWGNVSSMIMQTSHQVMGLAPMLTARGASIPSSYGAILKANQMLIESKFGGKYKDADIQQMVDRARREGVISSWLSRELDHAQDLSMVNRMRATMGQQPQWKAFDLLKNNLYQGYGLIRRLYDMVPVYNSEIAFVASMLHLRSAEGGRLSGEELYNEARFLKDNTMFPGGKENRPGFFQVLPRSAAQGLWSLQTYANGLTTMMGELIRRSVNPKGAGLTPAQGRQVRKAAAQMLIAQTAVAGVLGLPFAQALLYTLQKIFPEHNVEQDIKDALAGLAGDDEQMGQAFSSIMTMGIPSTMPYGPDMGSRFALAGTFHVSPYSGVGWEQLVGPTGGVLSKAFEGLQALGEGKPMQTVQSLMPNGFARIWKALEQGQQYTTQSGQMLVDDLTPEEIVARMIGFGPSRVRRIQDFERLTKVTEQAEKAEQANWTKQQVDLLKAGQDVDVQQNLAQRVEEKKTIPARQLANDVAREFERQTLPTDLRRFGNRATVLAQKSLQGALGTQTESPSNTERLELQSQIAARLGLGGPAIGSWRHAAGVDQLMSMYPHLTTAQANLLLTHAVGSRPSPDLYEELLASGE